MGWLDFFTGGVEGQIKRHTKRLKNLNAQVEDREASAYWLAENGSGEAVLGLLGRFSMTYEHHMKDAKEKDLVFELLGNMGAEVTGPIRQWVKRATSFARPLQLIDRFEGPEATVALLLEMLQKENDPFKPEKKRQILIKLAEYQTEIIFDGIEHCLRDFDEGIRYAAVEAMLAQEHPMVQSALSTVVADRAEESNRLRVRIADAFRQRNWGLGEHVEAVSENPPVGWVVKGDRLIPE